MKHLLVVTLIVFISCKEKETLKTASLITVNENISTLNNTAEAVEVEPTENEKNKQNSGYLNSAIYKGTLNKNIKITMYLTEHENPCGGGSDNSYFNAMFMYDNQSKWILLNVNRDHQKTKFCMVEDGFTGALFLQKTKNSFNGHWISPDTHKQFKVELIKQNIEIEAEAGSKSIEELDEILFDQLLYSKNDC